MTGRKRRSAAESLQDRFHGLLESAPDAMLPGMGGGPIAAHIRAIQPGVKVLFTSGYTDDMIVRGGLLERGAAFLEKPFTPAVLASRVREVLDKYTTRFPRRRKT